MRTCTVYCLAVLVLAGMLSTGGCVSKAKYDELMAMNRKANDERNAALAAAQQLRADNQRLTDELANRSAPDGQERPPEGLRRPDGQV
jgi:outer membrane murein-binding lipoprotein Lpp